MKTSTEEVFVNILTGGAAGCTIALILTMLAYGYFTHPIFQVTTLDYLKWWVLASIVSGTIWGCLTPAFQYFRQKKQLYRLLLFATAVGVVVGGMLCLALPEVLIEPGTFTISPIKAYLAVLASAFFGFLSQVGIEVVHDRVYGTWT